MNDTLTFRRPTSRRRRSAAEKPMPPRVLVLERQAALRHALRDLLRRQGLDVTADAPDSVDLHSGDCPWDAVVFNAAQRPVRRKRWLFGYKPDPQQTRLVALHDEERPPAYERYEVDATLPYPFTVSALINAILGDEAPSRASAPRRPLPATSPDDLPPKRAA